MGTAGSRKGIAEARTKVVPCNALHGEDYYIEFAERNTSEINDDLILGGVLRPYISNLLPHLDPDWRSAEMSAKEQSKKAADWLIKAMLTAHKADPRIRIVMTKVLAHSHRHPFQTRESLAFLRRLAYLRGQQNANLKLKKTELALCSRALGIALGADAKRREDQLPRHNGIPMFRVNDHQMIETDESYEDEIRMVHLLRLIGLCLHDKFVQSLENICTYWGGQFDSGGVKSFSRLKYRLDEMRRLDRAGPNAPYWPRSLHSPDVLRCTVSFKLPRKAAGFIRAVCGLSCFSDRPVRFLNDFDEDLENNAYRSATLNMVYSPLKSNGDYLTYGEIPAIADVLTSYAEDSIPGVLDYSRTQYHSDAEVAVNHFRKALRKARIQFIVEIRVELEAHRVYRNRMHYLHLAATADDGEMMSSLFIAELERMGEESNEKESDVQEKALEMAKRKAAQNGLFDLFCQCVENGHESAVDYILKRNATPVATYMQTLSNTRKMTPLMIAADAGHLKIVKRLASEVGTDMNATCGLHGKTALCFAAESGHEGIVRFFLAQVTLDTSLGNPLRCAASNFHSHNISLLLPFADRAAVLSALSIVKLSGQEQYGCLNLLRHETPLFAAARRGKDDLLKQLLNQPDASLRLNEKNDDDGFTALMVASKNGHVSSVRLLLAEDGIQINETCAKGKSALFYAAKGNHEHVVGQILSHGPVEADLYDALRVAETEGHDEVALKIAQQSPRLATAFLCRACRTASKEKVKAILQCGAADVNQEEKGMSPLCWASWANEEDATEIVAMLLRHNELKIDQRSSTTGKSPLEFASMSGHKERVSIILQDFKFKGSVEQALLLAVRGGHCEVAALILSYGGCSKAIVDEAYSIANSQYQVEMIKILDQSQ
eukprot:g2488.t1